MQWSEYYTIDKEEIFTAKEAAGCRKLEVNFVTPLTQTLGMIKKIGKNENINKGLIGT